MAANGALKKVPKPHSKGQESPSEAKSSGIAAQASLPDDRNFPAPLHHSTIPFSPTVTYERVQKGTVGYGNNI